MKRLLLAGSFLAVVVAAQQASGPQQKVVSIGSAPKKSTESKATQRPSLAIGNDIVRVIDALVAAGATKGKGEYETTQEYRSRQKAIAVRYEQQLTFLVPGVEFTYNADKAEMTASLTQDDNFLLGDDPISSLGDDRYDPPVIIDMFSKLVHTTYIKWYGTMVPSDTYVLRGIVIAPLSPSPVLRYTGGPRDHPDIVLSMQPDEARSLKPFLRVLLVGKLAEGRVYKETYHKPPILGGGLRD